MLLQFTLKNIILAFKNLPKFVLILAKLWIPLITEA